MEKVDFILIGLFTVIGAGIVAYKKTNILAPILGYHCATCPPKGNCPTGAPTDTGQPPVWDGKTWICGDPNVAAASRGRVVYR